MKTYEDDGLPLKKRCYWKLRRLAKLAINEETKSPPTSNSDKSSCLKGKRSQLISKQLMKREKSKILQKIYSGKFPRKIRTSRYTREKTKSPPTSNSDPSSSLTENTSTKDKRSQIISIDKSNQFNVSSLPILDREWMVQMMREKNISEMPTLILERTLSASDVDKGQSRLLMPFNVLKRNDFLTLRESEIVKEDGVGMILVNERFVKWGLRITIWGMGKQDASKGTSNYALNWGWYDVVEANDLKAGDGISLWSFRDRGVLCFALEHRPNPS